MNKEELAKTAVRQYSNIRSLDNAINGLIENPIKPDPYRSEQATRRLRDERRRYRERWADELFDAEKDARRFYKENHAELYDMAREEMEAEGHTFNEGDPYAVTAYYYGQEIADLEQESPVDALGAKIVHIAQSHIDHINEELGR